MPLITSIDEIKNYLAIDVNTDMATLQPFISEAELLYIKPLLGNDFYQVFQTDYESETMSEAGQSLLPYVQRALSYYMAYLSVEQIGVNFGDMGIQQQFGEGSQPAPRWKIEQLQLSYIQKADLHAEKLLEYLEQSASALLYQEWYEDPVANTKLEGWIVNSTRIASFYVDINDSRRIFLRMKKRIKDIEANYIKKLICKPQYDELVAQIKADTLTLENGILIEKLQPIISKMALYQTIPSLRIGVSDAGLTIYSSNDSVVSKQAADKDQVKVLMASLKSEPFGYESDISELEEWIKDNIADYPMIETSDCYTIQTVPGPKWQVENSVDNKHFSV